MICLLNKSNLKKIYYLSFQFCRIFKTIIVHLKVVELHICRLKCFRKKFELVERFV